MAAKKTKVCDGSLQGFLDFIQEYRALLQKYIPSNFVYDHDSLLYTIPAHRHMEDIVASLPKGAKLLDLGCGRGNFGAYLSTRGLDVVGLEIKNPSVADDFLNQQDFGENLVGKYPLIYKEAQKRYGGKFGYFNGKDLPFKKNSLDGVMFYAAYEHIPVGVVKHMTEEAFRVLKPGGKAYIYRCPSQLAWKEHLTRFLFNEAHEKRYWKSEIFGLLKGAGFKVIQFGRSDFWPAFPKLFNNNLNAITPFLLASEKILLLTPFRFFFHHFEIMVEKPR